jgi:hypothetical protein
MEGYVVSYEHPIILNNTSLLIVIGFMVRFNLPQFDLIRKPDMLILISYRAYTFEIPYFPYIKVIKTTEGVQIIHKS